MPSPRGVGVVLPLPVSRALSSKAGLQRRDLWVFGHQGPGEGCVGPLFWFCGDGTSLGGRYVVVTVFGAGSSRRTDGGYDGDGETFCRKHWASASRGECTESVVGSSGERVGHLDLLGCGYFRCGSGVVGGAACGCGRWCTR